MSTDHAGSDERAAEVEARPHGLRTTDRPCPKCGEVGHEVALILGLRSILCPNMPLGEIGHVTALDNEGRTREF
jgi:hypothetical protein